jgi:hypothetical protein
MRDVHNNRLAMLSATAVHDLHYWGIYSLKNDYLYEIVEKHLDCPMV